MYGVGKGMINGYVGMCMVWGMSIGIMVLYGYYYCGMGMWYGVLWYGYVVWGIVPGV